MHVTIKPAPKGAPISSWAVVSRNCVVGGFPTPESARSWAEEWHGDGPMGQYGAITVKAIIDRAPATAALAAYEAHRQGEPD